MHYQTNIHVVRHEFLPASFIILISPQFDYSSNVVRECTYEVQTSLKTLFFDLCNTYELLFFRTFQFLLSFCTFYAYIFTLSRVSLAFNLRTIVTGFKGALTQYFVTHSRVENKKKLNFITRFEQFLQQNVWQVYVPCTIWGHPSVFWNSFLLYPSKLSITRW